MDNSPTHSNILINSPVGRDFIGYLAQFAIDKESGIKCYELTRYTKSVIGRSEEKQDLLNRLKTNRVVGISGFSGQGKKTLALHAAWQWRQQHGEIKSRIFVFELPLNSEYIAGSAVPGLGRAIFANSDPSKPISLNKIHDTWGETDLLVVIDRNKTGQVYKEFNDFFEPIKSIFHMIYVSETAPDSLAISRQIVLRSLNPIDARLLLENLIEEKNNASVQEALNALSDHDRDLWLDNLCAHIGYHAYSIQLIVAYIDTEIDTLSLHEMWEYIQSNISLLGSNDDPIGSVTDLVHRSLGLFSVPVEEPTPGTFRKAVEEAVAFDAGSGRIVPEFIDSLFALYVEKGVDPTAVKAVLNGFVKLGLIELKDKEYSFHPLFYRVMQRLYRSDASARNQVIQAWAGYVKKLQLMSKDCTKGYEQFKQSDSQLLGLLQLLSDKTHSASLSERDNRTTRDHWFGLQIPEQLLDEKGKKEFQNELQDVLKTAHDLSTTLRSLVEPGTCYSMLDTARIAYRSMKVTEAYFKAKFGKELVYDENEFVEDDHHLICEPLYFHLRRLGRSLQALDVTTHHGAVLYLDRARIVAHMLNKHHRFIDNLSGAYQNLADYYNRQDMPLESYETYLKADEILQQALYAARESRLHKPEAKSDTLTKLELRYLKLLVNIIQNNEDLYYFIDIALTKVPSLARLYQHRQLLGIENKSAEILIQHYWDKINALNSQSAIDAATIVEQVFGSQDEFKFEIALFIRFTQTQSGKSVAQLLKSLYYTPHNTLRSFPYNARSREDLLYIFSEMVAERAVQNEQDEKATPQEVKQFLDDLLHLEGITPSTPAANDIIYIDADVIEKLILLHSGYEVPSERIGAFVKALYRSLFTLLRYEYYRTRWFAPIADILTYASSDLLVKNWFESIPPKTLDDWKAKVDDIYNIYTNDADSLLARLNSEEELKDELEHQESLFKHLKANHAVMHRDTASARKLWQDVHEADPQDYLPVLSEGYVAVIEAQMTGQDQAWEEAYSAYTRKPSDDAEPYWKMVEEASDIKSAADGFYDLFWYFVQRNDRTRAKEMLEIIVHFTVMLWKNQDSQFNQ
jgi:hypothetical protein